MRRELAFLRILHEVGVRVVQPTIDSRNLVWDCARKVGAGSVRSLRNITDLGKREHIVVALVGEAKRIRVVLMAGG